MLEFKIENEHVRKLCYEVDTHTIYKELMKAVCDVLLHMRLENDEGRIPYSNAVTEFGQNIAMLAQRNKAEFDLIERLNEAGRSDK
jgi:hypothetical protein